MKKITISLSFALLASVAFASTFAVQWGGSLRAVHGGDTTGKVNLEQFKDAKNLFAVGPVAELGGEITVINGVVNISRVRHDAIVNDKDMSTQASFLVWSDVKEWGSPIDLSAPVASLSDIDKLIEALATKNGLDTGKPFPFVIEGNFANLKYHVLVPKKSAHGGQHTDNAKNVELKNTNLKIVGFYSKNHEGVFTHKGSLTHLHAVEANGNSGHVDDLVITESVKVSFPKI